MGLRAAYAFFFLRFTDLHQILTAMTGFNNYLLYLFGIPAVLGVLLSGGIQRAFRLRSSRYLLAFVILMSVASVFSTWIGGSIPFTLAYLRTSFPCFLLLAGLIMTWKEYWRMLQVIAFSAAVNVVIARTMGKLFGQQGRMGIEIGTNNNPNDFAAVLILLLPFLGLFLFAPKQRTIVRLLALAFLLASSYLVLASGSRGALLGMSVATVFTIFKLPARLKVLAVLSALAACLIIAAALPTAVGKRLVSFGAGSDTGAQQFNSDSDIGAQESWENRKQLLEKSLLYTIEHPLLGVGPDQFPNYEGKRVQEETGHIGQWHETHNSYTQISSENGIPAVVFFLMALGYSYFAIRRVYRLTKKSRNGDTELKKLNLAAFCLLVSMVGFCVTITFNNFGYQFFIPAFVGLAVVMTEVTEREFRKRWV